MIIVGELINTSRSTMKAAVRARDVAKIQELAVAQAKAGANYIDVNCGTFLEEEEILLPWLVEIVQEAVGVPLCLDSPNPEALKAALKVHQGVPLINSISGEEERFAQVLPIVEAAGGGVIALCMDDSGIAQTAQERFAAGKKLGEKLISAGIEEERIFFDPLLQPVATDPGAGPVTLEVISKLRAEFPNAHIRATAAAALKPHLFSFSSQLWSR